MKIITVITYVYLQVNTPINHKQAKKSPTALTFLTSNFYSNIHSG